VSVPRFHVPAAAPGARLELPDHSAHHAREVLRLRAGAVVHVFDGAGAEFEAALESVTRRGVFLRLGGPVAARAESPLRLVLALSPLKGDRMELVIQKATELGAAAIVPIWTARTVVQPGGDGRLRRWRTIAQEAARQCGRADVPAIADPLPLQAALQASAPDAARKLLLWEESTGAPLRRALSGDESAVHLLVGAEGGFTAMEADAAQAAGFEAVGLGPRILRTETAALVALALVQAALGGLD
jgi:16S rRNA (uracil1498-N3)-methyltransferase